METSSNGKGARRILDMLAAGKAGLTVVDEISVRLETAEGGRLTCSLAVLAGLAREGLVERNGRHLLLTPEGRARAARERAAEDPFLAQHRELETIGIARSGELCTVVANAAESPLRQLARRRGKSGAPFLDAAEFRAGERLRADFTRGQIMPRMGANWEASVASGRRGGGVADLTDAALAARLRVDAALAAVGPELSGLLVDVCCFLKGLETVETERGWPARSAKLMLKTALGMLSRHYDPPRQESRRPQLRHWGATDYRPSLG